MSDTRALQQELNRLGYGPLVVDGIYGRHTAAAYQLYLDEQPAEPLPQPPAPPAPVPWWTSRALWGALATLAASAAGLAGYALDATQITELAVLAATLASGLLAFIGTLRRRAPIDQTLVARLGDRTLRLPVRADRPDRPRSGPDQRRDPRGLFTPD